MRTTRTDHEPNARYPACTNCGTTTGASIEQRCAVPINVGLTTYSVVGVHGAWSRTHAVTTFRADDRAMRTTVTIRVARGNNTCHRTNNNNGTSDINMGTVTKHARRGASCLRCRVRPASHGNEPTGRTHPCANGRNDHGQRDEEWVGLPSGLSLRMYGHPMSCCNVHDHHRRPWCHRATIRKYTVFACKCWTVSTPMRVVGPTPQAQHTNGPGRLEGRRVAITWFGYVHRTHMWLGRCTAVIGLASG